VSVLLFLLLAEAWCSKSFDHVDPGTANDHYAHQLSCFAWYPSEVLYRSSVQRENLDGTVGTFAAMAFSSAQGS
jgi:hypothetical protein